MHPFRLLALLSLILLVAGCAQNPQNLRLSVEPPKPVASVAGGPGVALETVDRREDKALGRLENRDQPAAPITSAQDMAYVLKLAAGETLQRAGFSAELWSDSASPRLLIEITELEHVITADIPRKMETRVTLNARAWRGNERITAKASTRRDSRIANAPGKERNAAEIEKALADALRELFDQRLVDFLAGRG
ncbi:YajG family lipoprotein [Arhodomonas sp. SL1]|uniref:YajG family lipoprotein n=1 Tax=Arhodomonas sp. SL1 TaxID=3425691 RepID=UPI003F88269E